MSLREETLFGTVDKVAIAIERIRTFEPPEGYYVAFSGGKDSCVILDLVKRAGVQFDAHYNLTTVDPPELVHFIRREHPEVAIHKPELTMWQLIVKNGILPTRQIRYCCSALKEGGGHGRLVITGIRWQESVRRSKRRMMETCYRDQSRTYLHPIIDWSSADIWNYIRHNNLPYCSLYDEGKKRLGCVMCPMAGAKEMKRDMERWPKIAAAYRRACDRAVEAHKDKSDRNFTSGQDLFDWWISGASRVGGDDDQTVLFE
jgi:phosphoadenosine phosphosulfate reductase